MNEVWMKRQISIIVNEDQSEKAKSVCKDISDRQRQHGSLYVYQEVDSTGKIIYCTSMARKSLVKIIHGEESVIMDAVSEEMRRRNRTVDGEVNSCSVDAVLHDE